VTMVFPEMHVRGFRKLTFLSLVVVTSSTYYPKTMTQSMHNNVQGMNFIIIIKIHSETGQMTKVFGNVHIFLGNLNIKTKHVSKNLKFMQTF